MRTGHARDRRSIVRARGSIHEIREVTPRRAFRLGLTGGPAESHAHVDVYAVSLLERRLHLLLDQDRYALVAGEAERTGRSVAAVIREAIDQALAGGGAVSELDTRAAAARRLLERAAGQDLGPEEDWEDIRAAMDDRVDQLAP